MSESESNAVEILLARAERFEKVARFYWMVAVAIVGVALWVAKIQGKVDQVDGLVSGIRRIDRNIARLGDKANVALEPPKD